MSNPNTEIIQSIKQWFSQAKPQPTPIDKLVQLGCHFEEVAEFIEAIDGDATPLYEAAEEYKNADPVEHEKDIRRAVNNIDRIALLDALCDQIVTAIGVGYMMGFDMEGALAEVNRSNWSKFVDGKPMFDKNGKIAKPASYSPPDLKPFLKSQH